MSMAVGGSGSVKSDINMTPMIDVLLVLIIIFMVITPLTPKGLEALVPQPPPPGQKANESDLRTVVITIDAQHNMAVNSEATDETKLGGRLEEIFKTRAERVVFVKGDPGIDDPCGTCRLRQGRPWHRLPVCRQGDRHRARRRDR